MSRAVSKVVGESIEEIVLERVDELQPAEVPQTWDGAADDYWHDAVPEVALFGTRELPMVGICVIEPGQPVEIKSARATISDGTETRHGRFNLTRIQHERLIGADGVYLFVLYEDGDDEQEILGLLAVPAIIIEDELRSTWYELDSREDYWQLSASRLPIDGIGGDAA